MSRPVIISCALTGSGDTTGASPYVPVTPEQIAREALAAHAAGAADRAYPCPRPADRRAEPRPGALSRGLRPHPRGAERPAHQPDDGPRRAFRTRRGRPEPQRDPRSRLARGPDGACARAAARDLQPRRRDDELRQARLRQHARPHRPHREGGARGRGQAGARDLRPRPRGAGAPSARAGPVRGAGVLPALPRRAVGGARHHRLDGGDEEPGAGRRQLERLRRRRRALPDGGAGGDPRRPRAGRARGQPLPRARASSRPAMRRSSSAPCASSAISAPTSPRRPRRARSLASADGRFAPCPGSTPSPMPK